LSTSFGASVGMKRGFLVCGDDGGGKRGITAL
jgi:hypothetical protein